MFFNVDELIERLTEIKKDGYKTVEIDLVDAEEDLPGCMTFSVEENDFLTIDYEMVDAIE